MQGRLPQASALYQRARTVDPSSGLAAEMLVSNLLRVGHLHPARAELNRWLMTDPDNKTAKKLLGELEAAEAKMAPAPPPARPGPPPERPTPSPEEPAPLPTEQESSPEERVTPPTEPEPSPGEAVAPPAERAPPPEEHAPPPEESTPPDDNWMRPPHLRGPMRGGRPPGHTPGERMRDRRPGMGADGGPGPGGRDRYRFGPGEEEH